MTRHFCDGCGVELQWNENWRTTFRSDSGVEGCGHAIEVNVLPQMADSKLRKADVPIELCRACVAKVVAASRLPCTLVEKVA